MQESMEKTTAMIEHFAEVNKILEKYNYSAAKLIPILQETQDVYKCLIPANQSAQRSCQSAHGYKDKREAKNKS